MKFSPRRRASTVVQQHARAFRFRDKPLCTNLEAWVTSGPSCIEAVNGKEAVEKARELNPGLVILDVAAGP